jgi:hypothetical protein
MAFDVSVASSSSSYSCHVPGPIPVNHKEDKHVQPAVENDTLTILCKVLIVIMLVTGPSAASSLVLYTLQASIIYALSRMSGSLKVHPIVLATMWRLVTRHVFFATNHGCAFNRLQYSAAFVATKEFYFVTGGISLFLNTFGWEVVGLAFAWLLSQHQGRSKVWRLYGSFQLIEALASCISVSLLFDGLGYLRAFDYICLVISFDCLSTDTAFIHLCTNMLNNIEIVGQIHSYAFTLGLKLMSSGKRTCHQHRRP